MDRNFESWNEWLSDLPIDADFNEGIDQLQDFIAALAAEVARLTADRDAGAKDYCALMDRHDAAIVRAEAAEAELDAWREQHNRLQVESAFCFAAQDEIDGAWDAIGTAGNRQILTLPEQISALCRDYDDRAEAAEAAHAATKAAMEEAVAKLADMYRLHLRRGSAWDHEGTQMTPEQLALIKPLDWNNFAAWTYWAEAVAGTYRVTERSGSWRVSIKTRDSEQFLHETDGYNGTLEIAQEVANAHNRARILAALDLTAFEAAVRDQVLREALAAVDRDVLGGKTARDAILALIGKGGA